jgi:metallophosphoesterase (TIGR00282 family)
MNILFIGDIIGRPGRSAVKEILPDLKKELDIDFVIANGENLASGLGMTIDTYEEMLKSGIDYFTSGNHIWNKKEFLIYLQDKKNKVLRPANYPEDVDGKGWADVEVQGKKIRIINLQGRVFMRDLIDCPFRKAEQIIKESPKPDIIFVDFHAEATSEKNSLAYFLDGKITAFVGTHTHIQTSDARILPNGTAYITDAGMVGPIDSSIGDDLKHSIRSFLTGMPFVIEPAKGSKIFNSVLIKIDSKNRVESIEAINRIVE